MPTISFDVTVAKAIRIQKAVGTYLDLKDQDGLPRDATGPEIRQFIIVRLRDFVLERELDDARKVITTQPMEIT